MPRNLITSDIIAKEALFSLSNHCVMGELVHREYKKEFVKVGRSVAIKKPNKFIARDGQTATPQEIDESSTDIVIDKRKHVAWEFDSEELTMEVDNYSRDYIEPAVIQLANAIDLDVAAAGAQGFFYSAGVPGSTPANFDALADTAALMDDMAIPDDGWRNLVLNPRGRWGMASGLQGSGGVFNADIQRDMVRKGRLGEIAQFEIYGTQNIANHQRGTFGGTVQVNQAAFTSGTAQITVDGITGAPTPPTPTVRVGDVFTIDGVFAVNPVSRQPLPQLMQFTVIADSVSAGGNAQVAFYPPIEDGSTVDREAYQNVSALPADNAVVTFLGNGGEIYPQNLAFHRNALALVTCPLHLPDSATFKARMDWEGYSIRVVKGFDVVEDTEIIRLDVFYGVKAIYPELGVRLWG